MNWALFSMDGLLLVLRWMHVWFGIVWIGLLYYFNFVQGAFFAETDAATKSGAIQKLVPRALWWFRWAALWTMALGATLIGLNGHVYGPEYFSSGPGITIMIGGLLGLVMGANVWMVIWPNQRIVIQNALDTAAGQPANPAAAAAAAKAGLASRHNTLFSIPMLFFMLVARHLAIVIDPAANRMVLWGAVVVIIGVLEINAVKGKLGVITTVNGVIAWGFVLAAVLYACLELLV